MKTWTAAAKAELEKYLAAIRRPLEQAGADAVEVVEDLKRHIEADVAASSLAVVTVRDLKPMLARIGEPSVDYPREEERGMMELSAFTGLVEADRAVPKREFQRESPAPPEEVKPPVFEQKPPGFWLLFCAVIYPAVVLLFEWATGFCARHFFDPIPTLGHVALAAVVPVANGFLWWALRHNQVERFPRLLSWLSALAMGVSVIYAIVFLPLLLPAVFALMLFGLGLLPMAPFITAEGTRRLRKRLKQTLGSRGILGAWVGIALAALAFLLVDIRHVGTTIGLQIASGNEGNRETISWLRKLGHRETLLRACYPRPAIFQNDAPLLFLLLPKEYQVTAEQAQRVYFQVYGRAFNAEPTPQGRRAWMSTPNLLRQRRWDPERGGEKVGSIVPGLEMRTSRLDATVEAKAALSYLEWIFEFRNSSPDQAEARCEILLPPGATVSRLTLWINGEEREAAFAGRTEVQKAYQNVVMQRRDPVLVTSSGRDTILMQCFPVPPHGGKMKVRVGITVPLQVDSNKDGILRWPMILEQNFALREKLEHTFWLDSSQPVESLGVPLTIERTTSGHYMAHGNIKADSESVLQPAVLIKRTGLADSSWVYDQRKDDGSYITQTIQVSQAPPPREVVVVLDGSAATASEVDLLKNLTIPRTIRVIAATEPMQEFTVANSNDWARVLSGVRFEGGQDNIPALERAWDLAAAQGHGSIIWVHGAQPVALSSIEALNQRFERRRSAVELLDVPIERGPNAILTLLHRSANWTAVPLYKPVDQLLSQLLLEQSGQMRRHVAERESKRLEAAPSGAESNLHLARAWAREEIDRLVKNGHGERERAVAMAGLYQLVTEVSGAVVLETVEQFEQAGLKSVDPKSVPVVPEPGTWALMILGGLLMFWGRRALPRQRDS